MDQEKVFMLMCAHVSAGTTNKSALDAALDGLQRYNAAMEAAEEAEDAAVTVGTRPAD